MPNGAQFVDPSEAPVSPPSVPPPAATQAGPSGVVFVDPDEAQPQPASPDSILSSLNAPDSDDLLDPQRAKVLYEAENRKTLGQKTGEFVKGAWNAGKGIVGDVAGAVGEVADPRNWPRVPDSLVHGAVQGTAQTYDLGRMLARSAFDRVRDLNADEPTKIEHFRQRINENLISQRALARGNNPNRTLASFPGLNKPLPNLTSVGSMVEDPITLATMGLGGALEAPAKAVIRQTALDAAGRGALSAAEKASGAVARAAGSIPEQIEKRVGASGVLGGAAAGLVADHVPVVGHLAWSLGKLGVGAKLVEQSTGFLRRLAETNGDSVVSRLQQIARMPDTPKWMAAAAGRLDKLGIGNAAQYVNDLGHSAAHGAAMGGVMAAAGAETPEQAGELTGGGAALGAFGRGLRKFSGADAVARRIQADLGAKQRFAERLLSPVEQGGSGLTPDELTQIPDGVATAAGHAADILGDGTKWRVLRPGEALPGGEPNATAAYDPITRTINFRMGDTTDRHLHELGHAVDQAIGAPGEARLQIDSIFSPEQREALAIQYASRLAGSSDPAAIAGKIRQLNDAHKGDQWLYNEIYAEAGYGSLKSAQQKYGRSFMQSMLGVNKPLWQRLGEQARARFLNTTGDFLDQNGNPTVPRNAIFSDPAVYNSPALRKLFIEHLNTVRREGPAALAGKGEPTVNFPQALLGKHPKAPKQMLMENGLALQDARGNLRRSPVEERRRDKVKTQQVGQALATEQTRPQGDTSPEVAPRVSATGEKEVTGSKIMGLLSKVPGFGPFAREVAAHAERLMGTGDAFKAGYFAVGTSEGEGNWRRSVARNSGDMPWQEIDLAPFEFRVDSKNHVLITGLSVSAADRKIARWAQEGKLDMWSGDAQAFRKDLLTYLKNHAEGKPGAEGLGENKKNLLNVFVAGKLNPKEANPLREAVSKQDRGGIIRSLRLDRISSHEDSQHVGWHAEYPKKKFNFSMALFSPSVEPRAVRAAAIKDPEGKVWEAEWHMGAMEKYWQQHKHLSMADISEFPQGFTTNNGEFLTRDEALRRAEELGQMTPGRASEEEGLHSGDMDLNYSPKTGGNSETSKERQEPAVFPPGTEQIEGRIPVNLPAGTDKNRIDAALDRHDIATAMQHPQMRDFLTESAARLKAVPGFRDIKGTNPEQVLPHIVDRMVENLLFLYNRATPENKAKWRQWYDIARDMTNRWGEEYGYDPDVVAAVNARLSPQKDWYQNVTMTRLVMDTIKDNPAWTEADRDFTHSVLENAEMDRLKKLKKKGERPTPLSLQKYREKQAQIAAVPLGAKLDKLDNQQAAFLIRSYNDLRERKQIFDHNLENVPDTGRLAWQSYGALRSVMAILRDQTRENVSKELGNNHKVRSFYNNHVDPMHPTDVTVDTHAVCAADLMPYGSLDPEIKQNFGAIKNKNSEYAGTYFVTADAYRKAAAQVGLLPRELQSIVWEQIRHDLSPEAKRQKDSKELVEAIWKKAEKGKISRDEAREQVMQAFDELNRRGNKKGAQEEAEDEESE